MNNLLAPPRRSSTRSVPRRTFREPVPRSLRTLLGRAARWVVHLPLGRLLLLPALLAIGGGFYHYLLNAEQFQVDSIVIQSDGRLSESVLREHLLRSTGLEEGVTLFGVTPRILERELRALPEVADAFVAREWPNQVTITLREYRPAAVVMGGIGSFLVTNDGFIFARAQAKDFRNTALPVYTGFNGYTLAIGERLPTRVLTELQRIQRVIRIASPELYDQLAEVHFDPEVGYTLVLEEGTRLHLGFRAIEDAGPVIETALRNHAERFIVEGWFESAEHLSLRTIPRPDGQTNLLASRR